MKYLFYIGTGKYSLSTEKDLLKISPGDLPGKKKNTTRKQRYY